MNEQSVVDISGLDRKRRARAHPKGRPVEPQALAEIRALLGEAPRRRDLLIEFLHRIQDRYGHISGRAHRRAGRGNEARADRGVRGGDLLPPLRRRRRRRDAAAGVDRARLRDAVVPDGGRRCAARGASADRENPACASSARRASDAASTRRPRSSVAIRSIKRRRKKSRQRSPASGSKPSRRRTSTSPRIAPTAAIARSPPVSAASARSTR